MKIIFLNKSQTEKRIEYKFIISKSDRNYILSYLYSNKIFSKYKPRSIHSIYYDNNYFTCAQENLSGLSNRKKYRLRFYNFSQHSKKLSSIFEIKLKKNNLGSKIKNKIFLSNINNNLFDKENLKHITKHLTKNDFFEDKINFNEKLLIEYYREYFVDHLNKLSITLDSNLIFKDLFLSNKQISVDNLIILEIKFLEKYRDYCSELFKNLNISRCKSSKYLIGFNKLFLQNILPIY